MVEVETQRQEKIQAKKEKEEFKAEASRKH